jgi:hypothetical protein
VLRVQEAKRERGRRGSGGTDTPRRLEVYELTLELRRLETALEPDSLSTTAREVLARLVVTDTHRALPRS